MISFGSIFPAGLKEEQRSGNRVRLKEEEEATRGVGGAAGCWMSRCLRGRRWTRDAPAVWWGELKGEVNSWHRLNRGSLARGCLSGCWSDSKHAQAAFARFMSSPGYFDVLGSPCKPRLPVIYPAALYNAPLRSLTERPRSSKTLFPVTPGIKKTQGDLQTLPSSCFQFPAFKNKIKRKRRVWFLLPRGALSISGCLTGTG